MSHTFLTGQAKMKLMNYTKTSNISRILTIGDSQGRRYHGAVMALLQETGFKCKRIKTEANSYVPGKGYFIQGTSIKTNAIVSATRTCHSCRSTLHVCSSPELDRQLEVEYISMMMVANSSIVPNKTFCLIHPNDPDCNISTQQEFLFKIYLKNRYPDLVFIYGTSGHDRKKSIPFIDSAVHHVINVIQETLPASSKTVWFTSSATYLKRIPAEEGKARFEHGWTYDEKIDACNWLLFHALKPYLKLLKNSKMYGFFNLYSMSQPVQPFWASDFVHFKPTWYKFIIEYLFAMLIVDGQTA